MMMSDNRTTELREKLTERGVEYVTNDHMGVCETSWNGFMAMQLTPSAKLIMTVTPEQAIAATLGSGTLTAEQVREAIERHSAWVIGNNRCFHDGAYEEIADELNAELGRGTCELELNTDMTAIRCDKCGYELPKGTDLKATRFCGGCGRRAR